MEFYCRHADAVLAVGSFPKPSGRDGEPKLAGSARLNILVSTKLGFRRPAKEQDHCYSGMYLVLAETSLPNVFRLVIGQQNSLLGLLVC